MSEQERENNKIERNQVEKPSLDRAGVRSIMGSPEKFEFSFYGVLMALLPLIIAGIFIWRNW